MDTTHNHDLLKALLDDQPLAPRRCTAHDPSLVIEVAAVKQGRISALNTG